MSNVRITATGDEALSVEVLLGNANRAWHDIEAGDSVDLAVGGNQTLSIGSARENPSIFVTPDDEPAVETKFVEGADPGDLPVGVDVGYSGGDEAQAEIAVASAETAAEPEVDVIATVPAETVAEPEVVAESEDAAETEVITPEDVGSLDELFAGEAQAEAEVVQTLEADSPLEVGSIADLPSAFDSEEEAEDKDSEAQA